MSSSGDKLTYFLVGGFVGAAIALLFAPKSGEQTRHYLGDKYREGSEKLAQKTVEGKELVKEKAGWLADKAREQKEAVTEKGREVAGRVTETIEKGKETIQRQKEQVARAVDAGKEAYTQEKKKKMGAGKASAN